MVNDKLVPNYLKNWNETNVVRLDGVGHYPKEEEPIEVIGAMRE